MMILETGRGRAGFSLLEILITLAIIALFSGALLLRFDDGREADLLESASQDIRSMALKAKNRAYTFRRDQYIFFDDDQLVLSEAPPGPSGSNDDSPWIVESEIVPSDVEVRSRLDDKSEWRSGRDLIWRFRSSGLSDPVQVQLSVNESFTELTFNVLTAIAEEETFIRN